MAGLILLTAFLHFCLCVFSPVGQIKEPKSLDEYFDYMSIAADELPTLFFGAMTIVFCVLYCILASVLVYFLAPKTFKLRN